MCNHKHSIFALLPRIAGRGYIALQKRHLSSDGTRAEAPKPGNWHPKQNSQAGYQS
jgi:hypothetical protein